MKKTLIVIDMQRDFINGALGTREAEAIVERVKEKILQYEKNGHEILYTRDTHQENYLETMEGKYLPVVHCVEGSEGWQIAGELPVEGREIIDKPSFGYTDWAKYNFEEIEIVGLCTDICVVSNALILKAFFPEIKITVDASCCAGVTVESHKAALLTMKMCQIEVVGEEENV